jgi:hypothetical protein
MMTCEQCGKEIPDNIAICPNCGTVTSTARARTQPPTKHGPYSGGYIDVPPDYAYTPQQNYATPPLKEYRSPQQNYGYGQPYNTPPIYQSAVYNVTVVNTTNNTPLIVELLLSIFLGIYGVGWLMAGEVAVGVILLICSLVIYLPLLIVSVFIAFFTFGFSLFCTGPMAIGAIVLNAILLNNRLKQKAAQYVAAQPK